MSSDSHPHPRGVFESSAWPLLVLDARQPVRTIAYATAALEILLGYTTRELFGRPWSRFLDLILDESVPGALRAALESGRETTATLAARGRNGAVLHLDAAIIHLHSDTGSVTQHVVVLRDVTAEHHARRTLEHHAYHDPLTGLANRLLLHDRFEHAAAHAVRHREGFALLVIDLNGFKMINDSFGHVVGDALLVSVAQRLSQLVRAEDTVARLGGDEFALLLISEIHSPAVETVTRRVRECLDQPVWLMGRTLSASCSLGTARFPDDGSDLAELIDSADKRLYVQKLGSHHREGSAYAPALGTYPQFRSH